MSDTDPPEALPSYVEDTITNHSDDPEVLAAIRAFADDLHAEASDAVDSDDIYAQNPAGDVVDIPGRRDDGWTYVRKKVTCGDDSCKCADGEKHGPYVYRVRRNDDGLEWEYVGKELPDGEADVADADAPAPAADPPQ